MPPTTQMSGWMMSQPRRLQQSQEFEPAVERLTGGQRALQAALELAPGVKVLRTDRFLEEERVVGCQGVTELHRLRRLEDLGVRIESNFSTRLRTVSRSCRK